MNDDQSGSPAEADGEDAARESDDPDPRLGLDIVLEAGEWGDHEAVVAVVEQAGRALAAAADPFSMPVDACVVLADDETVHGLNRDWRSKDKPTNVLSFPAPADQGPQGRRFIGDVILAAETVAREAGEMGIPRDHHLMHLVIHGLLHLAGHDHETDEQAAAMEKIETAVLATLGVADPHADPLMQSANE